LAETQIWVSLHKTSTAYVHASAVRSLSLATQPHWKASPFAFPSVESSRVSLEVLSQGLCHQDTELTTSS